MIVLVVLLVCVAVGVVAFSVVWITEAVVALWFLGLGAVVLLLAQMFLAGMYSRRMVKAVEGLEQAAARAAADTELVRVILTQVHGVELDDAA